MKGIYLHTLTNFCTYFWRAMLLCSGIIIGWYSAKLLCIIGVELLLCPNCWGCGTSWVPSPQHQCILVTRHHYGLLNSLHVSDACCFRAMQWVYEAFCEEGTASWAWICNHSPQNCVGCNYLRSRLFVTKAGSFVLKRLSHNVTSGNL